MKKNITLQELNNFKLDEFIAALGTIFEHSSWVAEQVYPLRPFECVQQLHQRMTEIVQKSSDDQRKILICNHPELAGKEAEEGTLTSESRNEQASAGLNNCNTGELQKLRELNQQYRRKFHFPFVIAVKQLTRFDILNAIESRLQNSPEIEFKSSITEIEKIAEFRLNQLISND